MNTQNMQNTPTDQTRALGYWLQATRSMRGRALHDAYRNEGITRRDGRTLSVLAGYRDASRPLDEHRLHRLIGRGWVTPDGAGWALTDNGRAAADRIRATLDGIRSLAKNAVTPEEYATTVATLEKIARAYGWDENTRMRGGRGRARCGGERHGRFGGGRGHGRGHGRFGDHGHGHGHGGGEREHRGHGHGRFAAMRLAQCAFERGYEAGLTRAGQPS